MKPDGRNILVWVTEGTLERIEQYRAVKGRRSRQEAIRQIFDEQLTSVLGPVATKKDIPGLRDGHYYCDECHRGNHEKCTVDHCWCRMEYKHTWKPEVKS